MFNIKKNPISARGGNKIYSPITGKVVGIYKLDFIINDKIILEIKAVDKIPANFIEQLYSYLRIGGFELGIFVNFQGPQLYIV